MGNISRKVTKIIKLISVLLLFIAGKLVDYYISNHAAKGDFWVDFLNNDFSIKMIWIIFCSIVLIILFTELYEIITIPYKEKIIEKQKELGEKNRQIEQNSGIIFNKYGELAKFNKKSRFYDVLKSFVDNNTLIECAQIYKYSHKIENNNIVKIRVNFEEGYAYENVDINGILQSYYYINLTDYKELKDIIEVWKILYNYSDEVSQTESECLLQNFLKRAPQLLEKIINHLNTLKDIYACNEQDFSYYRIALILIKILHSEYNGIDVNKVLQNILVENYLISTKRTGILGAILLEDSYVFKHVGESQKNGRMYFSFYFKVYNENYLLLASIPPNELNDKIRWDKELIKVKNDFILRMENTNI
ncbi:hypothetical protein OSC52_12000 [Clostridium pasteurianum]|uniref:hypothetical protein n=1 Tax=Clostridium pasteurianum TaxID=1501 RepID=UPI002260CC2E|nr:hypothetical protein [Clostridium pasteurianum]UZW12578.1 hypothetical protein OSC52_12000 [Clostridium pasteurianum]